MVHLGDEAVKEIESMVRSTDSRVFRFLRLYMMANIGDNNIHEVLESRNLLTKPVVFTAWETGRVDILRICLRHGVPISAPSSVQSAIRSASVETLDFCVQHGGSVFDLSRPYCHCTSPQMMEHIWNKYGCKLYDRNAVFPRELEISIKYMELGGTVRQMGEHLNDLCHKEGNWRRSLPIKRAYLENTGPYEDTLATRLLSLPKCLVNRVCEFM